MSTESGERNGEHPEVKIRTMAEVVAELRNAPNSRREPGGDFYCNFCGYRFEGSYRTFPEAIAERRQCPKCHSQPRLAVSEKHQIASHKEVGARERKGNARRNKIKAPRSIFKLL